MSTLPSKDVTLLGDLQVWMKLLRDAVFSGNADISTRLQVQGEELLQRVSRAVASSPALETSELPPVRRFRPLVEGGHIHSMSEVGNPNGHGGWHVEYVLAVDYDKLARRSEKAIEVGPQARVVSCTGCDACSRVYVAAMDDVTRLLVEAWNTRDGQLCPSAWMRWVTQPGGPWGPTEHDVETVYGEDQPEGDGWIPLYRRYKDAHSAGEPR